MTCYIVNRKADNFKTSGFTIAVVTCVSFCSYSWIVCSICILCGSFAVCASSDPSTSTSAVLYLHWVVCCFVCICICYICTCVGLSTALSVSASTVPVLVLSRLLHRLYLLFICLGHLLCLHFLYLVHFVCIYVCVCYSILVLGYPLLYLRLHLVSIRPFL